MSPASPPHSATASLIFGHDDADESPPDDSEEALFDVSTGTDPDEHNTRQQSMYVDLFEGLSPITRTPNSPYIFCYRYVKDHP